MPTNSEFLATIRGGGSGHKRLALDIEDMHDDVEMRVEETSSLFGQHQHTHT